LSQYTKKADKCSGPDDTVHQFASFFKTFQDIVQALEASNTDALRVLPVALRGTARNVYVCAVKPRILATKRPTVSRAIKLLHKALYDKERVALELVLWERCRFAQFSSVEGGTRAQFAHLVDYLTHKQRVLGDVYAADAHLRNRILGATRDQSFMRRIETSRKRTSEALVAAINSAIDEMELQTLLKASNANKDNEDAFVHNFEPIAGPIGPRYSSTTPVVNRTIGRYEDRDERRVQQRQPPPTSSQARRTLQCYVCGGSTHLYRDCKDPRRQSFVSDKIAAASKRDPRTFRKQISVFYAQLGDGVNDGSMKDPTTNQPAPAITSDSSDAEHDVAETSFLEEEEEKESFNTSASVVVAQLANRADEH
jgi:hypothetical protein